MKFFSGVKIIVFLIGSSLVFGCGTMRSEVFRGESKYQYSLGVQAYKAGEYEKAKKCFKKTIKFDSEYARAYACLGNVALMEKKYAEAEKFYRKAIEKDSDLKEELLSLLLTTTTKKKEQEIKSWAVNLKKVYDLLNSNQVNLLEKELSKDVPIDLLVKERLSISFEELKKLDAIIVEMSINQDISPKLKYFIACYMFERSITKNIAAVLIEQAAKDLTEKDKHKAYFKAGTAYELINKQEKAITMYNHALEAGASSKEVAQKLSKIYNIPVEELIRQQEVSGKTIVYVDPDNIGIDKTFTGTMKIPEPETVKYERKQPSQLFNFMTLQQ